MDAPFLVVFLLGLPVSPVTAITKQPLHDFHGKIPMFWQRAGRFPWGQSSGGLEIQGGAGTVTTVHLHPQDSGI